MLVKLQFILMQVSIHQLNGYLSIPIDISQNILQMYWEVNKWCMNLEILNMKQDCEQQRENLAAWSEEEIRF